jgi:hypothetical protein|tara:strand:+ start:696 stop:1178 length:483 start_codon:yes stop_codon:yes gene_type:complete
MAFATIQLKSKNGAIREAPVGFSWTTFFLSFWVPLTRGDWMWAIIMFIAIFITFGFAGILFAFIYNRLYIESLLKQGYSVKSFTGEKKEIEASAQIKLGNSTSENALTKKISSNSNMSTTSRLRSNKKDLTHELEELQELYEDGTLSEAQFKKAKNKLLR